MISSPPCIRCFPREQAPLFLRMRVDEVLRWRHPDRDHACSPGMRAVTPSASRARCPVQIVDIEEVGILLCHSGLPHASGVKILVEQMFHCESTAGCRAVLLSRWRLSSVLPTLSTAIVRAHDHRTAGTLILFQLRKALPDCRSVMITLP